ncbi:carcinoembryonic antigen-related cell adhesion molecule 1-like protein [Cricetulus griseus]|uniref:Carcinoembryonic antigen-related cell adhesion molecule 1-like protein n=1 Tax=Cricetulus griseus TaxID=10029 RepID=A0A061HVA6_CRIGR|nr:carcinoembryonic antigen-related cell adhesion molecule 1-like protein [Cricetulus griseus]
MELTSAPLHKGKVLWRGLLLVVSLLTYWISPTTAQVTVEAVPPHVVEGADVFLKVHSLPPKVQVLYWFKENAVVQNNKIAEFVLSEKLSKKGPAHSGRETMLPNGSLLFRRVTSKDAGTYMLVMYAENLALSISLVQFHVYSKYSP